MTGQEAAPGNAGGEPLVSVITPFHNTAEFLAECIASVLAQTYRNFEYILVDNQSSDGSGDIAREFAARDPRLRVVSTERLFPQVENYNRALQQIAATSRYVKVVQADDWLFPTCIEEMVRVASMEPRIGVVGSFSMYGDQIGHVGAPPLSGGPVLSGREAARRFLMQDEGFLGSPTCVMYRSDLVRGRDRFFREELDSFEDVEACLSLLEQSDFGFCFQVLTFNRRGNPGFWERIESFRPVMLHLYLLVKIHGRAVLDAGDLSRRERDLTWRYYGLLARHLLSRNLPEFWTYHLGTMRSAGVALDQRELRKAVARETLQGWRHPVRTACALVRIAASATGRQLLFGDGKASQVA
jgi:glycosyltransferase involved in cell wall biosynthesis